MFKSKILQIYHRYDGEKVDISQKHEKEWKEVERIEKAILEKFEYDTQLKKLLIDLQNATSDLNFADFEDGFKEAFILGAQIALEICGVECKDQ
ncbi:MAG: hypothetical protein K2L70_08770 [Clostridia bacterium]|nr:hypothetical protein [Clostridia bacterium]